MQVDRGDDGTVVAAAVGRRRTDDRGRHGSRLPSADVRRGPLAVRVRSQLLDGASHVLQQVRQDAAGRLHQMPRIVSVRAGRAHVHRGRKTDVRREYNTCIILCK